MLIKSLQATNFRKYHKLVVKDIPESGIITVAGSNESGKTSIGEAICFALYGRTFFLDEKNLNKIVCWGTDIAEVTLTFKDAQGDTYELWRSLDRSGESHVKLQRTATVIDLIDDHHELDSEEDVAVALSRILGFDYDAFANSFYLAQRELTSPDPQSNTIKQMAGIGAYAKITDDFEALNQKNEEAILELKPQIETTQAELEAINLDETWLPELIDAEETLGSEQKERETLVGGLNDNEQSYTTNFGVFHSARKKLSVTSALSKFIVPAAIILWLVWVANKYFKESFSGLLAFFLSDSAISTFSMLVEKWAMPAVIIAVIVYFLLLLTRKKAKNTMHVLNQEAQGFAESLKYGHRYVTTLVETLLPERVVQMLHQRNSESSTLQVLPPREQFNNLTHLTQDAPDYRANIEEITAAVTRLTDALRKQDGEIVDLSKNLLDDISEEKARSDQAGNLRSTLQGLNKVVDKCRYSIETQNIAIGLMHRAAKNSIDLFNKNIADISANTLPKFTENRYSEVRIAEDFSVEVYSDEKNDYMDFDEISSGTQRQIMLALRMAMSEELAINTGNDQQFIFLDEPFAFFDQHRTKSTMRALPEVSKVINQIWISAQEFPADVEVEKMIECPLDETELVV
jgi:exonuclease SbcC